MSYFASEQISEPTIENRDTLIDNPLFDFKNNLVHSYSPYQQTKKKYLIKNTLYKEEMDTRTKNSKPMLRSVCSNKLNQMTKIELATKKIEEIRKLSKRFEKRIEELEKQKKLMKLKQNRKEKIPN